MENLIFEGAMKLAIQTIDVRIIIRNDSAANWVTENPTLFSGEMGVEIDTGLFKFGNGTDAWNDLEYASTKPVIVLPDDPDENDWDYPVGTIVVNNNTKNIYILTSNSEGDAVWEQIVTMSHLNDIMSQAGLGDMLKSEFATNGTSGVVDHAVKADKLSAQKTIALTGDVTGTVNSDLSGNVSITTTLAEVLTGGAASGLYKITVDAKGRVTAITNVTASDLPELSLNDIGDIGTTAGLDAGTDPGNVVVVEDNGFINPSLIPAIAIVDVKEFDTIPEMLAWEDAEQGDVAIVNLPAGVEVYMLKGGDPATLGNWARLNIPTGAVVSVNGQTGVVTLTTSNIAEGTNLYFTETRATNNFNTNFALSPSTGLADGNSILRAGDVLILNGGSSQI